MSDYDISKLSAYKPILLKETPLMAAVMVILLTTEKDVEIVITKRSHTLPTYAGHFSLPGGIQDAADEDLYATAMRETQEELNLLPDSYQYIGQLDDFLDHDGNLVRPFVVKMLRREFENKFQISANEIAQVYYLQLAKLHQFEDNPKLHQLTRRRPSYAFTEGDVFIWGLTANILVHLFNIISDQHKPLGKKIS